MLVEAEVIDFLRKGPPENAQIFSASCVERMVQVYIYVRGSIGGRDEDLDYFVELLDQFWIIGGGADSFERAARRLESFEELQPQEVEVSSPVEEFCFYSVLVALHSALLRAEGRIDDAVSCGHVCLTAMGQFDGNNPGSSLFAEEIEMQRRVLEGYKADQIEDIRHTDRIVGEGRRLALSDYLAR
ncbi:hypothetical protein GCM10009551_019590 [Nocardiopsis tropica]